MSQSITDHSLVGVPQSRTMVRGLCCLLLAGGVAALCLLRSLAQDELRVQVQEQRRNQLEEVCSNSSWRSFEELKDSELRHFIVDDKHGIIYCFVPKVACTNWKKVLYALNQSKPYPDMESIDYDMVHNIKTFTLLRSFPRAERQARLKHYTKFLFVRDPFVRLISAYKNKFGENDDPFYTQFGRYILQRFAHMPHPPESADQAFELGIRPSFGQFIQYLLDPRTESTEPFEPHWRQMHRLCHPCSVRYDFIGRQETLQEDSNALLKKLNLEDDISFPPSLQVPNSADLMWSWYQAVPLVDRRRLYSLYKLDFQLFGYSKPHFL